MYFCTDEHNTDVGQALALSYFEGFISKALSNEDGVLRNIETNTVTGMVIWNALSIILLVAIATQQLSVT